MKDAFDPLGQLPLSANSFTAFRTSFLKISQQNFKKPKLNPSGLGLFELSQLHIANLTSSSDISSTNILFSSPETKLKATLSSLTGTPSTSSN